MPESSVEFVFLPLGGVGEIGMNMALYGFGPPERRQWLMVDCGVTFPDASEPGVDLIFPDIDFIVREKKSLVGIIITHAHEDHIGALAYLWPELRAPVYMTSFSEGMLAAKFPNIAPEIPITIIDRGQEFKVGPFELEFVQMSHSIPEPMAVTIKTRLGCMFHTADWKLDLEPGIGAPIDLSRIEEIGNAGVLGIVCDSTNVLSDGHSPSESEISSVLTEIIKSAPHRVAVTTFSSQIARVRAVALAAEAAGRHVVVVGRALARVISVARENGYLKDCPDFVSEQDYGYLPREKVVLLLTGSQGESRAALAKVANNNHRHVTLGRGDTVIFSSRTIPGNERSINAIINQLVELGMNVITDRDALVHASGHPRRGELKQIYDLLKPEVAIPVHGEAWHLSVHAQYAPSWGAKNVIPARNGTLVRLAPGRAGIVDQIATGRLYLDGMLIVRPEESGLRLRRQMAHSGLICAALTLDFEGNLIGDLDLSVDGLPDLDQDDSFEDVVYDAIIGSIKSIPGKKRDVEKIREAARRSVRAEVLRLWGKKPICRILISVV